MTTSNICECGYEKGFHEITEDTSCVYGWSFSEKEIVKGCPCKKFIPQNRTQGNSHLGMGGSETPTQNQARQDKSPRHSLRYAENNQTGDKQ